MTKSFSLLSSWLIIALLFICLSANGIQITNQQQIKNRIHQKQKINQKLDTKNKIEIDTQSQVDQRTEEDLANDEFVKAEGNIIKNSNVDDQAMYAYSKAMLNGENVMDLPDKAPEKEPEISDEQAMQLYTEQQGKIQIQITEQQIEEERPKVSDEDQSQILEFNDAVEKVVEKPPPPPTQELQDSQAAIDAVNIVIPEGMEVETHRQSNDRENVQTDNNNDDEIQISKEQKQKLQTDSDLAQEQSQAALDYISVQDPDDLKPKQKAQQAAKMEHLFDAPENIIVPPPKKDEPYVASALLDEENQALLNSKAATDDVQVKQVVSSNDQKQDKEPLMPQSLAPKKKRVKSESEIERSIRMAEKSQDGDDEEQDNQEEQVDAQISGSDNVWESQIEMGTLTEKLTRSKDYKTPAQMAKQQKIEEKKEKEKIVNELLAPTPISGDDMREYAKDLAQQSESSKSDLEIEEEAAAKQKEQDKKNEEKQKEIQEKKQVAVQKQEKEHQEEEKQIQQGQMARMQKKNDKDQQSLDDLKALEKLQRSGSLTQIDGLAEQAEQDEKDRAANQQVDDNVQAIKDEADKEEQEIEQASQSAPAEQASAPDFSNLRKVKELSQKLGVKAQPGDANLGSKEKIAEALVQRAIESGKTQDEIKKAMS